MRKLFTAALAATALLASAAVPASAQYYYGSGPDVGPGYAPGYDYGYGGRSYDAGPAYGGGYGEGGYVEGPAPGPVYEGRSAGYDQQISPRDSVAWCQGRYKSYDPSSGTYLGYDGARHPCP